MGTFLLFFPLFHAAYFYLIIPPLSSTRSPFASSTTGAPVLSRACEAIILGNEKADARGVPNAAALTYFAAALMAVMQLMRFLTWRSRE